MTVTHTKIVALARGIAEAAALAAIGVAITALTDIDGGQLAPWAPIGVLALRQLEGIVDDHIDPTKPRRVVGRALAGTTAKR